MLTRPDQIVSGSRDAIGVAVRICLSALMGCLCGYLFVVGPNFVKNADSFGQYLEFIISSLVFVLILFVLISPLTFLAVIVGISLRDRILHRPAVWSALAAFLTWIVAMLSLMLTSSTNEWQRTHTFFERLPHMIAGSDSMVVLVGTASAGLFFYCLEKGYSLGAKRSS